MGNELDERLSPVFFHGFFSQEYEALCILSRALLTVQQQGSCSFNLKEVKKPKPPGEQEGKKLNK